MSVVLFYWGLKRRLNLFYFSRIKRSIPEFVKKRGVLFVHIPKAAGISICDELYGREIGHKRAIDFQRADAEWFSSVRKFTIVRNPYSRLLSAYSFLSKGGMGKYRFDREFSKVLSKYEDVNDFVVGWLAKNNNYMSYIHFIPQADFLCDAGGNLIVDRVGKIESLDEFVESINSDWGLSLRPKRLNISRTQGQGELELSKEAIDVINEIYKKDFELLGYEQR